MEIKTPKTFEEYNFQEFLKTKQENETLKNELKLSQQENEEITNKLNDIRDLLKEALTNARVEKERYLMVYVNDSFVGLYNEYNVNDKELPLLALTRLIELVNAIPSRE